MQIIYAEEVACHAPVHCNLLCFAYSYVIKVDKVTFAVWILKALVLSYSHYALVCYNYLEFDDNILMG